MWSRQSTARGKVIACEAGVFAFPYEVEAAVHNEYGSMMRAVKPDPEILDRPHPAYQSVEGLDTVSLVHWNGERFDLYAGDRIVISLTPRDLKTLLEPPRSPGGQHMS